MRKLERKIPQWEACDPYSMASYQSPAAVQHAFTDAKHDVLMLAGRVEELERVLGRTIETYQMAAPYAGDKHQELHQSRLEDAMRTLENRVV